MAIEYFGGPRTLNGLTGASQTFAVASSGTDFAVASSGTAHTFNLPDASATARGVVTTGTQTIAGNKTFSGAISASNLSGTNTGDQTTVTGNAGSATVLQTARTINGVSFDGSTNIIVTAAGSTLSDTVTVAKGGTGLTALGTALQVLRVNAGATALEYATASGVGGSTGATDNTILRADGTGGATLQSSAFVIADNATASPNNTVNHASIQATGGTTNVSVSIVPKGTGAFCLAVPDGTATGGNARGANAIDLQTIRAAATEVASGNNSIAIGRNSVASGDGNIAIGYLCTSTGYDGVAIGKQSSAGISGIAIGWASAASFISVAIGYNNGASAEGSTAIGMQCSATAKYAKATGNFSLADRWGQVSHAAGRFAATGDAQAILFLLRNKTTNATPKTLFLDGSTVRLTIPSGKIMFANVLVSGIKSDGSAAACYVRKVAIKNVAGTTSLVGSVETIGTDIEDNASTDVTITADNTNDALDISVTGIASETWRWVAVVEGLEIAYGT